MSRKTALKTIEREGWGGSFFDSQSHAAMFRTYKPHNFGIVTSKIFSAEEGQHRLNKKFTYLTVAKGNVYMLPGGTDDYEWYLESDTEVDFRITRDLTGGASTIGGNKLPFQFAIDRNWVHEPVLLKTEDPDAPLIRIRGYGVEFANGVDYKYTGVLQTGEVGDALDAALLKPGKRLIRVSTSVSDELNTKFGPDQYGDMFKLQSFTGNFANKVEFTDKFIRREIAARMNGQGLPKGYKDDYAIGVGYVYQQTFQDENAEKFEVGVFITKAEARVLENTEMDREMNFEFGRIEKTKDPDSGRVIKTAPGWRQLVRDGHYLEHNGSLDLNGIYEFISNIFMSRRGFSDRKIILAVGEGFSAWLSQLIAIEASLFQYVDTHFLRSTNSMFHENALEFGSQFVSIKFPNGYIVQIVYDPMKDDRKLFPELAPGTNRTVESYSADIYDFGATNQKAFDAGRPENITCVMQDGVESFYSVSNVYDFYTGAVKDGSAVAVNDKKAGIYREMSGGLCAWDTSRIGKIAYRPDAA